MYKLPVWNTIGDSYRFIWAERGAWLNYILGPVIILSVLSPVLPLLGFNPIHSSGQDGIPVAAPKGPIFAGLFVAILLTIVIYISFVIAWHRRYLVGPENTSARELLTWGRRHWVFVGRIIQLIAFTILVYLVIGLVIGLPLGLLVGFPTGGQPDGAAISKMIGFMVFGWVIMLLVSVWLMGTWLMFPAAAVEDRGIGIRKSMALARGNRWRMVAVFLIGSFLPVFLIQIVLAGITVGLFSVLIISSTGAPELPFSVELLMNIISGAIYFLGVAIGVSLLSLMYRRLRDNVPLETETPAA
jgi:hypothetical protein